MAAGTPSIILLFTLVASSLSPAHALSLVPRADSCPSSYERCGNTNFPDSFCCPSSSTCVSLDNAKSAICCPKGQDCSYIKPITCDTQLQNATLYPQNPVKTTRLDDALPKCGDSCCPFGYTCQGNKLCAMDGTRSSTASVHSSKTTMINTTKTASNSNALSSASATTTETDTSATTDPTIPTIISTSISTSDPESSAQSNCNSTAAAVAACPSYPSKAVLAGFFPGAILGAVLALLGMVLARKHQSKKIPPAVKLAQHTERSSNGTLIGISCPIPSEDSSCRTDFLLRRSPKRNSEGARSMLQRTGTRVKSLFGSTPKIVVQGPDKTPPLPVAPLPLARLPVTPPRQRQASMESIRVYTPPGAFAGAGVLKPDPYPPFRAESTFTDMIDRVGFKNGRGDPCYRVTGTSQESSGSPRKPAYT